MTKEQIKEIAEISPIYPQATIINFKNQTQWVGFFEKDLENPANENNNFWSFVKFVEKPKKHHFNGEDVDSIEVKTINTND